VNNLTDITKHLFYSAWILTIIQMIRVAAVTIIAVDFPEMVLIADVAFDCALILFGIGLIRLGKELDNYTKWSIAPVFLFIAAGLDIINIIFSWSSFKGEWSSYPLAYLNLTLLIIYVLTLVIGFLFLKFDIDKLAKNDYIERKGQYFLALGFLVNIISQIIGWYGGYIGVSSSQIWLENLALYDYLFASFLIILGFFGLASTMKLLQNWSYHQELDEFNEGE